MSTNTIQISDETLRLKDIQDMFNKKFPHLTLAFFEVAYEEGQATDKNKKYDNDLTLRDIRKEGKIGEVSIHGNLKTGTLENIFREEFGIHVQVLRRSGNVWLQTTTTDTRTLSEQEEEGKEASTSQV